MLSPHDLREDMQFVLIRGALLEVLKRNCCCILVRKLTGRADVNPVLVLVTGSLLIIWLWGVTTTTEDV